MSLLRMATSTASPRRSAATLIVVVPSGGTTIGRRNSMFSKTGRPGAPASTAPA